MSRLEVQVKATKSRKTNMNKISEIKSKRFAKVKFNSRNNSVKNSKSLESNTNSKKNIIINMYNQEEVDINKTLKNLANYVK